MKRLNAMIPGFVLLCVCFFSVPSMAFAQNPFGIATNIPITHPNVKDGHIVVANEKGFTISNEAYQPNIIGVINEQAAIEIRFKNDQTMYPVITNGTAYVLVSLANGDINKGDYITSSPIEGIGMKATVPGQVIGVALEDAKSTDETKITKILTSIETDFYINPLFKMGVQSTIRVKFERLLSQTSEQTLMKYVLGGSIFIISLLFALIHFGRLSLKGVEALGRNPLAGSRIQVSIMANIIMGIAVCSIAFGAAIYIIRYL